MHGAGLTPAAAEDVSLALLSTPFITATSLTCQVDGEDGEIMEQDIVTCSARLVLTRASHVLTGPSPSPLTSSHSLQVRSARRKCALLCSARPGC